MGSREVPRLSALLAALFPAGNRRGAAWKITVPIRGRSHRRALSAGLAVLLGVCALICTTGGGPGGSSARGDSEIAAAPDGYGRQAGDFVPYSSGRLAPASQQSDLDAKAAEARTVLRESHSSVPSDQIDGLVERTRDHPDPGKGEISKKNAADALAEITDLARRENVNRHAASALEGKVVNAPTADKLAEARAEVNAVRRAAANAAPGTQVDAAVGVEMRREQADLGNGQKVDLDEIPDADVVYQDKSGVVRVVEVKNAGSATRKDDFAKQVGRLKNWEGREAGRKATVEIETTDRWTQIFSPFKPARNGKPATDTRTAAREMAQNDVDVTIAGTRLSAARLGAMQSAVDERTKNGTMEWPKMKDPESAEAYLGTGAQQDTAPAESAEKALREAGGKVGMTRPCPPPDDAQALGLALSESGPCGGDESGLSGALSSPTYGGVDFSSLQLRYLSDRAGSGVRYAFSAKAAQKGREQDSRTGASALVESMADLRTWLVLSPDTFWVNLNPDQPDRVIDTKLGRTNAGRALLEADWRMKQTEGKLLDPKTSFGAEYWRRLGISSEQVCYSSRMWIVPGDVEVREDGDSLYVLKATLDVKAEAEDVAGLGQASCNADPAETARDERLEQDMMVPKIVKAVNTDADYAPLRRAFLARVVAQWIRDRHAAGHSTSFDKLIGSGDVGPASLHGSWQPKQVYDSYLHSINDGDFTYKQTTRVGNTMVTYVMRTGGVDWTELPSKKLSPAQMDRELPHLPKTVERAAREPATASDGSVWLADEAAAPRVSAWHKVGTYVSGRTGIVVLVVVALVVLLLFVRDGSVFRRGKAG
ncbi:hypothetical protein [Streptomyces sp. 8L]|uniref:hypothetical protein n=1 Tax=Streptomyces sp. 8L TaxID=2877242 RepID=UPI001CD7DD37|nr:hypothetical protein [Streptomyces sp. 8L]MCA1222427.1 hypothetical protein [Streptomyces sp. 8L]